MSIQERHEPKLSTVTDGMLVNQILEGDQRAFEQLVQRYQVPLFNFICHCLGEYDLACDVAQHVFLKLYLFLPTLRTGEPLKAWLFQVARNRCLDELRRKRPIPFSELEFVTDDDDFSPLDILPDTTPRPDEIAEHHDLQHALHKAIDGLPQRFRSVVLLRYAGHLTYSEIGKILNMPEATAKTYFQRARPLLRRALTERWQPATIS